MPLDHWSTVLAGGASALVGVAWLFLKFYANARKLLGDEERIREIADAQAAVEVARAEAEVRRIQSQPDVEKIEKIEKTPDHTKRKSLLELERWSREKEKP